MKHMDVTIIGGGIVGVSTALQLKERHPDAAILLLEKEPDLARHQTGHNSGVIHSGVYYQPGSLKADFCRRGREATIDFCRREGVPFELCGKLLVATDRLELERLADLESRCGQNRIPVERLDEKALRSAEPHIRGLAALWVPGTGITDYPAICRKMAERFKALGGALLTGAAVKTLDEGPRSISVKTLSARFESRYVVACAGLQADRIARLMDIPIDFRIVPFRGEYYRLPREKRHIIRRLIYPVPDPDLPFLGVHLTRMIDGAVTAGPNAVLGFKREGYGAINVNAGDCLDMAAFPGFWRVVFRHLGSGMGEWRDAIHKPGYLKRVRKYCPGLGVRDLLPYPAGIRAQAVMRDGSLVHDFLFAESPHSLHVCNAPSPAATSAIPIGAHICEKIEKKFSMDL